MPAGRTLRSFVPPAGAVERELRTARRWHPRTPDTFEVLGDVRDQYATFDQVLRADRCALCQRQRTSAIELFVAKPADVCRDVFAKAPKFLHDGRLRYAPVL